MAEIYRYVKDKPERVLMLGISLIAAGLIFFPAIGLNSAWIILTGIFLGFLVFVASISLKNFPLIHLSLFFLLLFIWKHSSFWPGSLPTGLLIPSLLYVGAAVLLPSLRKSASWFKWGQLNRQS